MTEGLIYFAHPTNTYRTALETAAIEALLCDGWDVLNPADACHQDGYNDLGMPYFLDLIGSCEALAYMPFTDGPLGAGVAREVLEATLLGKPVFKINPASGQLIGLHTPFAGVLTIAQTRERLAA